MGSTKTQGVELLVLAYWWDAGLRAHAPQWITTHPLWPANNDAFNIESCNVAGGRFATACPGRDRLWEAINEQFGLGL